MATLSQSRAFSWMPSILLCVGLTLLVSGCSTVPSWVEGPETKDLQTPSEALAKVSSSFDVPTITQGPQAAQIAGVFAKSWRSASRERLIERDVLNNSQLALVVAGAVETARNALRPAKWYLAGAGGTGMLLDRYQVEAQGTAYKQGAHAMECMRNEINLVPTSIWAIYGSDGAMGAVDLSAVADEDKDKAGQATETLGILLRTIHDRLSDAVNKLVDNVTSKSLRVPRADDIAKAVADQQKAAAESEPKANALAGKSGTAQRANFTRGGVTALANADAPTASAIKTALDLPGKLSTCLSMIP